MNVVYHLRAFPKLSESFILNEIYSLVERGHRIAVFAFNDPGDDIVHSEFEAIDIPIRYANAPPATNGLGAVRTLVSRSAVVPHLRRSPRMATRDLYFGGQFLDFVGTLDWHPDVIHGHFASGLRTSAQLVADALEIPHVITCHANDLYTRENLATARRVLSDADRVVTVCESNRQFIETELGVSTAVDIVPASIPLEKFEPTRLSVDGRVLTIARLTEKKGLEYAIDTIANVRETLPGVSYHIVGSGELQASLEAQVRRNDLEDHVTLLNSVPEERLLRELDEAQVFLLPSVITETGDRDATPVVLKEALAMGTPCVSTDVCGIPEIVDDGENGVIVPSRDVESLTAAVASLLTEHERRARLGRKAREKARTFDISQTIERLEAALRVAQTERAVEPEPPLELTEAQSKQ